MAAGIHDAAGHVIGTAHRDTDAALWGAAPDLYAALAAVARLLPHASLPGRIYLSISEADAIRAALVKATLPARTNEEMQKGSD